MIYEPVCAVTAAKWWTFKEVHELRVMLLEGKTYGQIAERLGRTRGMIAGKVDRLALCKTRKPQRAAGCSTRYWVSNIDQYGVLPPC